MAASPRKWVSGGLRLVAYLGCTSALPRDCCGGVSVSAGIVVRFGSHRQPLQTRAAARFEIGRVHRPSHVKNRLHTHIGLDEMPTM